MNSSDFFYLYLYLINLKTINSNKSFTFLRPLGTPTKNKNNGEPFCRENKAATFVNIKGKAEPGQTKAREAYALLAFSGLQKTIESTNYRVGAKVSDLFGLPTYNKTLREERIGLSPLTAPQQKLWLCDTAQAASSKKSRLNALTNLKKYIKLAGFSFPRKDKTDKNRLSCFRKSLAGAFAAPGQPRNNPLSTSFTFLASSETPIGFYRGCEAAGLSQQRSENITTAFNQRILNQSFKHNLVSHLKNCEKSSSYDKTTIINTQKLTAKAQLLPFEELNFPSKLLSAGASQGKGRQSYQLSLTTSAPLVNLLACNNRLNLQGASTPYLGKHSTSSTFTQEQKVQKRAVTSKGLQERDFFSTISKQSLDSYATGEKALKKKHRYNSFFTRFVQKSLLYTKKNNSLTRFENFTKVLQNLPAPLFSLLSKKSTDIQKNEAANINFGEHLRMATKKDSKTRGYIIPSAIAFPLGKEEKIRKNIILKNLLLSLLLKQTYGDYSTSSHAFERRNFDLDKNKGQLPLNTEKVESLAVTTSAALTKFYTASWFLEYIRTELSLRNANIKRVLNQAFLLTQQPLALEQKKSFSGVAAKQLAYKNTRKLTPTKHKALIDSGVVDSVHQSALFKSLFTFARAKARDKNNLLLPAFLETRQAQQKRGPLHKQKNLQQLPLKKTLALMSADRPFNSSKHIAYPKKVFSTKHELRSDQTVIPYLIKGLKITFSGRTGGKKGMAKTLTKTVGRVPLSTLKEKIDFAKGTVQTKVGSLGIKVWICYN